VRPQAAQLYQVHLCTVETFLAPRPAYFTKNWEKVQAFQARPDDIVIVTYPKSGTTWVCYILDLLYFGCSQERDASLYLHERVPFLELAIPVLTLPQVVYVGRNPKDNAVSYFHFDRMNSLQPEPGDWNSFFHRFLDGNMVFGSWYDHVSGWWEKKQSYSNLLYLFYEDLVEVWVLMLLPGWGPNTGGVEKVHFDSMKNNPMTNGSTDHILDLSVSPFMRKGKTLVGDWKNHFTVAQNEVFEEHYLLKMKNSTVAFRTAL
uniref:Sulfotransferase n=1 Tax=Denticeps clupeoides TaxID=299321 RepID=A0AAY4DC29_9TELE